MARVYLHQICADPAVRGRGAGRALLDEVIRYAEDHGVREVALDTWADNASAQNIFAQHGFEVYRYQLWRRW